MPLEVYARAGLSGMIEDFDEPTQTLAPQDPTSGTQTAQQVLPPRRRRLRRGPGRRIPGLQRYRKSTGHDKLEGLTPDQCKAAQDWYWRLCQRWGRDLPQWRRAILWGQAKRLAKTTAEQRSAWGRRSLAKRGGYAVQRFYRLEGRDPTGRARLVLKYVNARRMRQRKGLPEPPRVGHTNLDGI